MEERIELLIKMGLSEKHATDFVKNISHGAAKQTTEMLKMANYDLEYAINTLKKSPVSDYKKDRDYLINVIVKVIDRNSNFLSENIINLVKEGAE